MKKIILLAIGILICKMGLHAQLPLNYTVKVGSHLSSVKGMETNRFTNKYGYHGGISIEYVRKAPVGFRFEAIYESKAFMNSDITNIYYKDIYYSNDVKQDFLKVPILFSYNFPKVSVDFGPHFDFLLHSNQKERKTEVYKDGTGKIDEFIFYNQHHFSKLSLGLNLGVNYYFPHGFTLSARYSQSFTNLGVEYPWKKYSLVQVSLGYTINRKVDAFKRSNNNSDSNGVVEDQVKYEFFRKTGVNRVFVREDGIGNKITIDYSRLLVNYEVLDMMVNSSTGFVDNNYNQHIIKDVNFPANVKVQFILKQKVNGSTTSCTVEFAIYQEGSWFLVFSE